MYESCYFWIDISLPEDEQYMGVLCTECFDKYKQGWFWDGSKGYGPFDYICDKCNKIIHKGSENVGQTSN